MSQILNKMNQGTGADSGLLNEVNALSSQVSGLDSDVSDLTGDIGKIRKKTNRQAERIRALEEKAGVGKGLNDKDRENEE